MFAQNSELENVSLRDTDGQIVQSQELLENGKAKVFLFWSRYCYYCKLEMKGMTNIGREWFEDYEAEVVFVSLASYPAKSYEEVDFLKAWEGETGVYFLHDDAMKFYNALGSQAIPSTALFTKDGEVHQQWHSYDDGLERSVGMYFKKLHNLVSQ